MFHWNFKCNKHDFKPASLQGCIYALAIIGQQNGNQEKIR